MGVGQTRPLQVRQRRRRALRAHVGEDHPAALLARVAGVADLRGESGPRRLVGHLQALAVHAELPPVIDAAHAGVLDAPEVERGAPVRAELADEAGLAVLRAERDEALAQELHALDAAP